MHGLGDGLHQRAVVRELMQKHELWLHTPWPQLYHDLEGLHLLRLEPTLRAMAVNQDRCTVLYGNNQLPPHGTPLETVVYPPLDVKSTGSVLGAMAKHLGVPLGDFRMPVPEAWVHQALALPIDWDRPLLVYRPLVERSESRGYAVRNPDHEAYHALFSAIRQRFFVVSLASLAPGNEWKVGPQITPDLTYEGGELQIETIAALVSLADLVWSAPGFGTVLAQAVCTPAVCVFGGFEDARSFSAGARFSPWLAVEPVHPCACWSHSCLHSKAIDLPRAHERIAAFLTDQAVACAH